MAFGCGSSSDSAGSNGLEVGGDDGKKNSDSPDAGKPPRKDGGTPTTKPPPRKDGGGGGGDVGDDGPVACGEIELVTDRVLPQVWLFVDGSGSMSAPARGDASTSRFAALREALLDPDGPIARLQDSIQFALSIYDGGLSPPGIYIPGLCPREIVVPPALSNYDAINAMYPLQPTGASTPTHYGLLNLQNRINMDPHHGPSYVILATDGLPNLCDFHDGIPSSAEMQQQAVTTVTELAAGGTKTYALSMGDEEVGLKEHLEAIAAAGDTGAGVFSPTDTKAMIESLSEILIDAVSCELQVQGKIDAGSECEGTVTLDGDALPCNGDDGFRVTGEGQTIELMGAACEKLQTAPAAKLVATFPCDVVVI